jgi:hypothetical protein
MNKLRKLLLFSLIIAALTTFGHGFSYKTKSQTAYAADNARVFIESNLSNNEISSLSTSEFQLTVKMQGNSESLFGVQLTLAFNNSVFKYERGTLGSVITGGGFGTVTPGQVTVNAYNMSFISDANFTIATLVFKLNSDNPAIVADSYVFDLITVKVSDEVGDPVAHNKENLNIIVTPPNSNSTITSLSYSGITLTKADNRWSGSVGYTTTSITIANIVTNKHSTASITFDGKTSGTIALAEGTTTSIRIVVTAQDSSSSTYYLDIFRTAGDTNVAIENLVVKLGDTPLAYTNDGVVYTVTQKISYANRNNLKISVNKPVTSKATLRIDGSNHSWGTEKALALTAGQVNNVRLIVTPEKGSTSEVYTIVINVEAGESNANLATLVLRYDNGQGTPVQLSETFNPTKTNYSAQVIRGTTSILVTEETIVQGNYAQIISGLGSHNVPGIITIVVRAEDGTEKEYIINVAEVVLPSDNNEIKSIVVQGYDIQFDKLSVAYILEVPYSVKKINIIAQAEDPMALVFGTGEKTLNVGQNKFSVYAQSQTEEIGTIYYINVTRLGEDTVTLSDLTIFGFDLEEEFNSEKTVYYITVPLNVNSIFVSATLSDETNYVIGGAPQTHVLTNSGQDNPNFIAISIFEKGDESRVTIKQYTIVVTRYTPEIVVPEAENKTTTYILLGTTIVFFLSTALFVILTITGKKKLAVIKGDGKEALQKLTKMKNKNAEQGKEVKVKKPKKETKADGGNPNEKKDVQPKEVKPKPKKHRLTR